VRDILEAVKKEGTGNNYLVQHSAGSGKSNTIAWVGHKLASLYQKDSDTNRLFDSIIVVTDRKILDKQLQDTIKQFEQVEGVVRPIDEDSHNSSCIGVGEGHHCLDVAEVSGDCQANGRNKRETIRCHN